MTRASPGFARISAIDLARGAALVAMAVYHFAWDLEFFGYSEPGTTAVGGWKLFARSIASSFLFLVGFSLFLAHAQAIRWRSFVKRLAMVAGAAAAISLATWIAVPGGFIFFGILHQIALASLLGLAFLRLPAVAVLALAAAVVAAPHFLRSGAFDHPLLWWVGLSSSDPRSNDYVPLFPWFGAVLAGMAAAKVAAASGLLAWLGRWPGASWSRPLEGAGRHSLAVYLVHQPVLIASIWLFAQVVPPPERSPEAGFLGACEAQCGEMRDAAFCSAYCVCVLDTLEETGELDLVYSNEQGGAAQTRLAEVAASCTMTTETGHREESGP